MYVCMYVCMYESIYNAPLLQPKQSRVLVHGSCPRLVYTGVIFWHPCPRAMSTAREHLRHFGRPWTRLMCTEHPWLRPVDTGQNMTPVTTGREHGRPKWRPCPRPGDTGSVYGALRVFLHIGYYNSSAVNLLFLSQLTTIITRYIAYFIRNVFGKYCTTH